MRNTKHPAPSAERDSKRGQGPSRGAKDVDTPPKWSARILRKGALTGPASVELTFPTRGGGESQFSAPYSEIRRKTLVEDLTNYLPIFPSHVGASAKAQAEFIHKLADDAPIELQPDKTGFVDRDTFVTHCEILRADGSRASVPRRGDAAGKPFTDTKGNLDGTAELVLKLADESTYLAFAIGVALAAPLPSYVSARRSENDDVGPLVRETAVFNFSGTSSSGKSSICLAALSLAGSPDRAGSLDFSKRGLAEMASDSNDLTLVLDDTEKADDGTLVNTLKIVVHFLPGGQSKQISRGADKFPPLWWSTFALSSSPKSIARLARENRWTMTAGDKVRLFNINVPGPDKGGIFDRMKCEPAERAKRSVELISKLERGFANHCGHVIPLWVQYLMAEERSAEIIKLVDEFVEHVGGGAHGWEVRFARKFGVIYAAMTIGIDAGLLPWPKSLPRKVAKKCYQKARNAAKTDRERAAEGIEKLRNLIEAEGCLVDASNRDQADRPIKIPAKSIGVRLTKDGRVKYGILDAAMTKILGTKKAKAIFTKRLAEEGILAGGHGHAGTAQERLKIKHEGKIIERPRLWMIDARKFARFVSQHGASANGGLEGSDPTGGH
jgi:hypothetical protein